MSTEDTPTALEIPPFTPFPSIARLSRDCIVTEKIDGTNAQILVMDDGRVIAGSRNRWISPEKGKDNMGFAAWVQAHEDELRLLGPGSHFGEWWGSGIQRGYGLPQGEKRFSLFNVRRWVRDNGEPKAFVLGEKQAYAPRCCHVVPILRAGPFDTAEIDATLARLALSGSEAAPGFMNPEGIVVFHAASGQLFKKTLDKNDGHKWQTMEAAR